ncbi:MAG TPA: LysR family transcriptional regulator [Polyangia bacterium]|jgi:DNA-binding transcriptional LysR family regulator|nr:LysR family transcriptional regulator [Polyangia bacterium]
MKPVHLPSLDLNLLVTLDAVLTEGSVQRASARLGVTQSAVSHALARLREALGDPLVVRTPRGMVPTARAMRLGGTLRHCLAELEGAMHSEAPFDPATAQRAFTLSAADATEFLLLPQLMRRLAEEAPGVDILVRPPLPEVVPDLESGALDLALGVFAEVPGGLRRQPVIHERFVCMVRRGHPRVRRALSLDAYLELSHISIAPRGTAGNLVDDALARMGRSRRVALRVPHFLVAPLVVAETDLVLILPEHLARRYAEMLPIELIKPPIELTGFTLHQLWHERVQNDAGHVWLRRTVAEILKRRES